MSSNRRLQRTLIALGGLALLALLAVGLIQLARSSRAPLKPSGLTIAQMQARLAAGRTTCPGK